MIKNLKPSGEEGMYIVVLKAVSDKPWASIMLNNKSFLMRPGVRSGGRSTLQLGLEYPSESIQARKIKPSQLGRKKQTCLFADDIAL